MAALDIKVLKDIVYTKTNDERHLLDIYYSDALLDLSKGGKVGNIPVLVLFHGGGLESGAKEDLALTARELVKNGVIAVLPNYRLIPKAVYPDFLQDAAKAFSFVKNNLTGILKTKQTCRFFIGGHSAGGYISLMLALNDNYLNEESCVFSDVSGFICLSGQPTVHFNVLKQRGDDPAAEIIDEAAPLFHAREAGSSGSSGNSESSGGRTDFSPMLVLCAENDIGGRLEQTYLLETALKDSCVKASFVYLKNHDHVSYLLEGNDKVTESEFIKVCRPFIFS